MNINAGHEITSKARIIHQIQLIRGITLQSIADAHQKSISQVILRWNIQRGVVVIPKSTHQQRIEENFAIWDFSLTEKEMAQISSLDLGYVGESVKHFNPEFVRGCLAVKIHD